MSTSLIVDHTDKWRSTLPTTTKDQSKNIVESITSKVDDLVDDLIQIDSDEEQDSSDEELEYDPTDQANICYNPKCRKICNQFDVHLWKGCDKSEDCEVWVCGSKACYKILKTHISLD